MAQLVTIVTQLAVHLKPHLDEIIGRWLLKVFGEENYPGVATASLVYWGAGGRTPDGRSADEWEAEGVLALGVGGGKFDEHPSPTAPGKDDHCVATLVAEHLGVATLPELIALLAYVQRIDTTSTDTPLALASLIKAMHEVHDGQFVFGWATQALDALYRSGQQPVSGAHKDVLAEVLEELGVTNDSFLNKLLRQVGQEKRNRPFSLPRLVQLLQMAHDDATAANWARLALQALQHQQQQFNAAATDFAEAKIEHVPGPRGQNIILVVMKTDNPAASRFARSKRAGVIIQQTSRGNIQIYVYKASGISLEDAARMLRVEEQQRNGQQLTWQFRELGAEGSVPGAQQWFYHQEGEMLLNGSLAHPDVPPTQIPLEEVVRLVKIGINPRFFDPGFAMACEQNTCAASQDNPCPLYKYGLHRCRDIRFKERLRGAYTKVSS